MPPDPESGPLPATADPVDRLAERLRAAGCVFAEEEAALLVESAQDAPDLERRAAERMAGRPLELVVGWAELAGVRVAVAPGVFVPRRRTEHLVEVAVGLLAGGAPGAVLVDLGCGTGAIGAAVVHAVPTVEVWAVDVDPAAVACARRNLPPERVLHGDLYSPLPGELRGRVDVVAANTPYVPSDQIDLMPREARDHEHRVALDGGADGLDVQRRAVAGASRWLRPGGRLLVETSAQQVDRTVALMMAAGLRAGAVRDEDPDGPGGCVAVGTYPIDGMESGRAAP